MWLLLLTASAFASEKPPEVGVTIAPLVAFDIKQESDTEDTVESWTWIHAKAKQRMQNGEWFFAARASHTVRHGQDTESIWRLDVGESGIAGPIGSLYGRAGNLVERWGKLDLTPVVDVLNPRDLSAGPLGDIEALRMPIPMVVAQASSQKVRAELSYAPFPQADRVQMAGSDWSPIRPGALENTLSSAATWEGESASVLAGQVEQLGSLLGDLEPSTMRALSNTATALERPDQTGLNGNASARMELEVPGLDLAIMGANLVSTVPQTMLSPALRTILQEESFPPYSEFETLLGSPPLQTAWPRTWFAGVETSTVIGPFGLRAESGWWSDRVVQQTWLSSNVTPAIAVGGGLDWAHGSTLHASFEGRWTRLLDPPDQLTLIAADTVDLGGTLRVSLAADRLQLTTAGLYTPTFHEWMMRPEVQWRLSDPVQIGLGAIIIDGPTSPAMSLKDTLRYTGGPMTMASDNDAVFASLRWIQ